MTEHDSHNEQRNLITKFVSGKFVRYLEFISTRRHSILRSET